jgi:hypothetical protein
MNFRRKLRFLELDIPNITKLICYFLYDHTAAKLNIDLTKEYYFPVQWLRQNNIDETDALRATSQQKFFVKPAGISVLIHQRRLQ